jgi:hypothetical protein
MKKALFQQLEPVSLPERAANALKEAFLSGHLAAMDESEKAGRIRA